MKIPKAQGQGPKSCAQCESKGCESIRLLLERWVFLVIDLHCHILPGIDDGAQTEQDALDMGIAAAAEGITQIVATPHHRNNTYENPKETILKHVEYINTLFENHNVHLKVSPGQEVRLFGEIPEAIQSGECLTMNNLGNYLFVEFPTNHVPRYTEKLFYNLQMAGVVPVIVHPERNHEIVSNPNTLYHLITNGALSQITAASIIGGFGKKAQKLSIDFIENNLTHFIASDAHNTTTRAFHLREAYEEVNRIFNASTRFMLQENAELLTVGEVVNVDVPTKIKEKKFLGLF